jgi:predicted nucleic acid-binding protein
VSSGKNRHVDRQMYVLDTNIVSELSPERIAPNAEIIAWLRRNGEHCYLSAGTLTKIAYGVARLRQRGATAKARRLGAWLDEVVSFHGAHILVVDADSALRAGVLLAVARAAGVEPDVEDSWIVASAELHGMTMLSFNETDFLPMGVAVCNPGVALPPEARPPA